MAEGLNKQYRTLRVVPEDKRDVKYGDSRLDGVSVDVAKFKPIAEKIKELQIAQRDDGREDQKKLAEMYADVTAHRVWKIVNQLASQLNQKLDEQADGWQDDAKKLLKDQLKEIEKLVASGAKTLQQAVQGAPVVKEIVKEVQKLVQPLSDKVDKLASESVSSGSKTSGSDSGASGTKPAGKTDSSSPTDVAVPAALAAIAQRISKLQQSIDGKIMSAFGKQNSLSLRVAEMVENIDKNLVGAGTGKAVQRKLNYAQYKVDSKAYSPIVRTATPNKKKSGSLLMGFGAGLELGKALPGLLAKAIIGLPALAVAWLGKKIFSFAGKALAWLFKPLQGALKFLVGAVGMILAPIKFIFGVLSTIGGVILGVVSVALKGVFVVLGGIFKLAAGIAKGVFKVIAGIFSFVPKAITWGFKTAFSMLKGIWGGVKSIWNWTKESIKSPGKIYKIAFIAGFVYGFIIKQIKKRGFMEWMTTLLKSAWKGLKIAGGFLWDSATAFAGWLKEQWNEHLKPAIVGWWNTWEPESKFGKFIKSNVNWVIDLFSDESGPNGKGVLGKNGPFMQWIDSIVNTIKGWFFDDEHVINQLLDNYEKKNKSTFMSDAKTEADWRAEKRGVRKEMLEAFKDPKMKAQLIAEYGQGIELDMTSPLTDIRNWLNTTGNALAKFFTGQWEDYQKSNKGFGDWLSDKLKSVAGDIAEKIMAIEIPIAEPAQKAISKFSDLFGEAIGNLLPSKTTVGTILGLYAGYHVATAIALAKGGMGGGVLGKLGTIALVATAAKVGTDMAVNAALGPESENDSELTKWVRKNLGTNIAIGTATWMALAKIWANPAGRSFLIKMATYGEKGITFCWQLINQVAAGAAIETALTMAASAAIAAGLAWSFKGWYDSVKPGFDANLKAGQQMQAGTTILSNRSKPAQEALLQKTSAPFSLMKNARDAIGLTFNAKQEEQLLNRFNELDAKGWWKRSRLEQAELELLADWKFGLVSPAHVEEWLKKIRSGDTGFYGRKGISAWGQSFEFGANAMSGVMQNRAQTAMNALRKKGLIPNTMTAEAEAQLEQVLRYMFATHQLSPNAYILRGDIDKNDELFKQLNAIMNGQLDPELFQRQIEEYKKANQPADKPKMVPQSEVDSKVKAAENAGYRKGIEQATEISKNASKTVVVTDDNSGNPTVSAPPKASATEAF